MKHGIDISRLQGKIDWAKLAAEHRAGTLDFVIIRAGYGGGTIDPRFEEYYAAATAAGIPLGAYWYAYWGKYTPTQEAASAIRVTASKILEYGLWYDVEYEPDILKMSRQARTDKVLEGLAALAASGRYVGLYASTDMINNRLEYERLRDYDIWVAQYAARNTCKLPYGIWQYTSGGSMPGIAGRVDRDYAYKDYPAFVTGPLAGEAAGTADKPAAGAGTADKSAAGAGTADKPLPKPLPSPAPGQEDRVPRETATYRITGKGKADADRLLTFCYNLGLYVLGTVEVQHGCGPVELLNLANKLALGISCSMHIGPATRGDLIAVLLEADSLGLAMRWQIDVGPVSTGDTVTLRELAAKHCWGMEEVS